MLLFADSMDQLQNDVETKMQGKYVYTPSIDQQLRISGRYYDPSDNTEDFAAAFMNTGFGRIAYEYDLDSGGGSTLFASFDALLTHGFGSSFNGSSDFFQWTGYDSIGATYAIQAKLLVTNTGRIQLWRSTGGNATGTMIQQTAPGVLFFNEWQRISIRFTTSAGVEVLVDGATVINQPGFVLAWSTSYIKRFGLCWESFGFDAFGVDNFVINDNTGTGLTGHKEAMHVVAGFVESTEDNDGFTPLSGATLHQMIYERYNFPGFNNAYHDRDSSYIYSADDETQCLFKFRRFFPAGATILGVANNIMARCSSGTASLSSRARSEVDNYITPDTDVNPSSSAFHNYQFIYPTDPTGTPWNANDFISQRWKFGAKLVSASAQLDITQIVVEVVYDRQNDAVAEYRVF